MQRAAAEGWKFGAKTVRGAYMVVERARAEEMGYVSPIWDSLQDTHNNYNRYGSETHTACTQIGRCAVSRYIDISSNIFQYGCRLLLV